MNLIGLVFVFAAYAINRWIMTEATKKLSDADKLRIFEAFSTKNNYATVLVLILVILYVAALQYFPNFIVPVSIIYLSVFFVYLVLRFVANYRKLKQLEMPVGYIKSFIASYSIFILGFVGMTICLVWSWI